MKNYLNGKTLRNDRRRQTAKKDMMHAGCIGSGTRVGATTSPWVAPVAPRGTEATKQTETHETKAENPKDASKRRPGKQKSLLSEGDPPARSLPKDEAQTMPATAICSDELLESLGDLLELHDE